MFKSSLITYMYQIFLIPFLITIVAVIWLNIGPIDKKDYNFYIRGLVMIIWFFVLLIIFAIRLKRITANENHFVIDKIEDEQIVDYADIKQIFQIPILSFISIKFYDKNRQKEKRILVIPTETVSFPYSYMFRETKMFAFLKSRIIATNKDYADNRHSNWLAIAYIFGSGAILVILCDIFLT